ncbi:hypothetical protein F2Q69_00059791 [Brassica cretica]|uniref:Uncharacterized protein n=1 Tax=Brassica cretica TaxID=69181 RepID=A0A8S9REM9_BRACR|nr:hypothetical protein F2Q69_00059791 [Brassica cretica]
MGTPLLIANILKGKGGRGVTPPLGDIKILALLDGLERMEFSTYRTGSEPMWIELWISIWGSNADRSWDFAFGDYEREKTKVE